MATVSNIKALQVSIALAERQVQRDQSQVQEERAAQARVNTQGETIGKLIDTVA